VTVCLTIDEFPTYFEEVHGVAPFPWQTRLMAQVAENGSWPALFDLPTGAGKTSALDIAVFHLALEADRGQSRRSPVRIALVVDRRLVVDDAYSRAERIAQHLRTAPAGTVTGRVAERLRILSGDGPPLIARRLRGGIPREDDWARTPAQPTILCSTVDQLGSRLLFRGYGLGDSMKPIHAGLIGADCLILLDEAHLAEPFRQTLAWVKHYRGERWRERPAAPWGVALMTATPRGETGAAAFGLLDEDRSNATLAARWKARKPARLVVASGTTAAADQNEKPGDRAADLQARVAAVVVEAERAIAALVKSDMAAPALAVVVNRVGRARAVFERLLANDQNGARTLRLMIGPARPVDRDSLADDLQPIRTGAERALAKPLVIVATQCLEAGVDIDLDGLVSEAAPLDALRQRFGRLNRAGRPITPAAAVVAFKSDLSARADDPVYGKAIKAAWDFLIERAGQTMAIDFGLEAFQGLGPPPEAALSPTDSAPVLMPAHLDLLSQTAPIPAADPDIALYLHGPDRQPASVTVVWRADVAPNAPTNVRRLLMVVPPRTGEAIELPVWAVRRWLNGLGGGEGLADVAGGAPVDEAGGRQQRRSVFRWAGDDDRSTWIGAEEIRSGDTIVVPATYGGVDQYGWNPDCAETAEDVAGRAAAPFAGRTFAVRVGPGLLSTDAPVDDAEERRRWIWRREQRLADVLAATDRRNWRRLREALDGLDLPDAMRANLKRLDQARGGVEVHTDLYGNDEGRPRGVVLVASLGLRETLADETAVAATEDDVAGSMPGFAQALGDHAEEVAAMTKLFAARAGLPEAVVADLGLAGRFHDAGKADPRFQALLAYGDPLGGDTDRVLAKSARRAPRDAGELLGLPKGWRHEALSVRLLEHMAALEGANDPELVLWLVGTHHGHGRPLFSHADPLDHETRWGLPEAGLSLPNELPPGPGPQSLSWDRAGLDWPGLFERLKARYGVWELARLEAVLRLADHRASEAARAMQGERP
jgi:CRISPR-associated endonuclease/helicase Cas3